MTINFISRLVKDKKNVAIRLRLNEKRSLIIKAFPNVLIEDNTVYRFIINEETVQLTRHLSDIDSEDIAAPPLSSHILHRMAVKIVVVGAVLSRPRVLAMSRSRCHVNNRQA